MTASTGRMRVPGLRASVALALAVFLVAIGASAGYAAWTATVVKSASVTAARATTTATGVADLAVTYRPGLPGPAASSLVDVASVVVTNTGTSPLAYSLTSSGGDATLNAQVSVLVWRAGSCSLAGAVPATATAGTLAAPPALPADANSAAVGAAAFTLCVRTTLTGAYPTGPVLATSPTLSVVGRVGINWSSTVATTFTQTIGFTWFELRNKTSNKCIDVSGGGAAAVGASVIIYGCKSPQAALANQSFRFALDPTTNFYRIYPGSGTTAGPVWEPTLFSTIQLSAVEFGTSTKANNQQWSVAQYGIPGEYRIVNKGSGLCITQASSVDTAAITVATCATAMSGTTFQNQRFTFTEIPS